MLDIANDSSAMFQHSLEAIFAPLLKLRVYSCDTKVSLVSTISQSFYLQHLWFVLPVSLNRMHSPCLTFSGEIMFAFLVSCWGVLTCTKALAYLWYIYFRPVGMRVTIGPQGPWLVVRGDFGWQHVKQAPVSFLVWHDKDSSLLKGHTRRTKA